VCVKCPFRASKSQILLLAFSLESTEYTILAWCSVFEILLDLIERSTLGFNHKYGSDSCANDGTSSKHEVGTTVAFG
jgi:hypothetical protein